MTYSDKIYNLAENYTSDSQVTITNTNIKAAADSFFDLMKDAHDDNDLTSNNYSYHSSIASKSDGVSGLGIFPDAFKTKIGSPGTRFVFKNKVNSRYIMVNDQRAFVFTDESDFDELVEAYNWAQADNVYSGTQVTTQYNGALGIVANNVPIQ